MIIELLPVLMIKGQKTNRYLSASKGARRNAEMVFKGLAKGRQRLVTALFRHAPHNRHGRHRRQNGLAFYCIPTGFQPSVIEPRATI